MRLLLIPSPRALVLASDDYALVFRNPPAVPGLADHEDNRKRVNVVVEFSPLHDIDLDTCVSLNSRVFGSLGILSVADETFIAVITSAVPLGSAGSAFAGVGSEAISRVLGVEFHCLSTSLYDSPTSAAYASDYGGGGPSDAFELSRDGTRSPASSALDASLEHPCAAVRRILNNGSFYYSSGPRAFDLSSRLEKRTKRAELRASTRAQAGDALVDEEEDQGAADEAEESDARFLWNHYLIAPLLSFRHSLAPSMRREFDRGSFAVRAIQGYCGVYELSLGGEPAILSLISRLGWGRAGTRFNTRGIDDDGNVANFSETETILRTRDMCFSHAQIRGSVPLFWEEVGVQPFGLRITLTRPTQASLPAFERHFEQLVSEYQNVHIVNLLSTRDQEATLTDAYADHVRLSQQENADFRDHLDLTQFDFHARTRMLGIENMRAELASTVGEVEEMFGSFNAAVDASGQASTVLGQRGVFRSNCKDCLDRTNFVQDILSRLALESFFRNTQADWGYSEANLWSAHRTLFAENGDALSRIYAGTGALNTSVTRSGKKSFAGLLSDATKSVSRVYQSNFMDSGKQKAIDALLGNLSTSRKVYLFNPLDELVRRRLRARSGEFTTRKQVSLWVGTYNLNGKSPSGEDLLQWLFPSSNLEPAILAVAFQEIVPLSPGQIMATDPEKKRLWEAHLKQTIASRPNAKHDYLLLRSGQLVGTALILFVRTDVVNDIRNVEVATKKTGLRGVAGNKGGIAIRLDMNDTSFCFVTAHLAAGHSNVEERNADYATIASGLVFRRGRTIESHDNVIWAADNNYRISMPNELVRNLALDDDYVTLMEQDQLIQSMQAGRAFTGYTEGPLLFRPTYKYDNGTDVYDSSEKQRVPAWTDRILFRGKELDLNRYYRAELYTSDHRPVYALMTALIQRVDHARRANLREQLRQELTRHTAGEDFEIKVIGLLQAASLSASPQRIKQPSSEQQAWWNEPDGTFAPPAMPDLSVATPAVNPFDAAASSEGGREARRRAAPPPPSRKPSATASVYSINSQGSVPGLRA